MQCNASISIINHIMIFIIIMNYFNYHNTLASAVIFFSDVIRFIDYDFSNYGYASADIAYYFVLGE